LDSSISIVNDGAVYEGEKSVFTIGFAETTISNADAFLAIDKNGNGKIDSRAELFVGGVGQGFAKLESFDSNRDGLVNAQDARFSKLKVWQDKNSNGITDCNELFSLSDIGIVSLKVNWRLKPQLYNQSPPTRTDT
jgi:hypothetical protein